MAEKEAFKYDRKEIVASAFLLGREAALDWIRSEFDAEQDSDVRQSIAIACFVLAMHDTSIRDDLLEFAYHMMDDESHKVRESALINLYFHHENGSEIAVSALDDTSYSVRDVAVNLLTGYTNIVPKGDFEFEKGEPRNPDPLLTDDVVLKALYDDDPCVFESMLEEITKNRVKLPKHVDPDRITRKDEMLGSNTPLVRLLAVMKNPDAHQRLIEFASSDTNQHTRSYAYQALMDSDLPIDSETLRKMSTNEDETENYEDLYKLILTKADAVLTDVVVQAALWALSDDEQSILTRALKLLFEWKQTEEAKHVVGVCLQAGKAEWLADNLKHMINIGLCEEAGMVIDRLLSLEQNVTDAILASGLLDAIPLERIEEYSRADDPTISMAALRAIAKRKGHTMESINKKYYELLKNVEAREWQSIWAILSAIDATLEFGDREDAIRRLEQLYDELDKDTEGSFPLRAAWERLRLLKRLRNHPIYSDSEPSIPYGWPDEQGPYLGFSQTT